MQPILAIFCAFSRPWALISWLEDLDKVEYDRMRAHLVFIIDGDYPGMRRTIQDWVNMRPHRSLTVRVNDDWIVDEGSKVGRRRSRIADIKEQSKELIAQTDCEIVIGLEDDTAFGHIGSLAQLYGPISMSDQVGFVEGVQIGRHGVRMVGAWEFDDLVNPQNVRTLIPSDDKVEITAGGFYGYATRRSLYLNHHYYSSAGDPWGPDVNFGVWVRQQGFQCLIDWQLELGHKLDRNDATLWPYAEKLNQVRYNKDTNTGKWSRLDS